MSQTESYRLFVALSVPQEIKIRMATTQQELRRALPQGGITWTKPEQLHLTLKFLGNVPFERLDALGEQLRAACRPFPMLHLRAERVGAFPDLDFPRVIWI